MVEGLACGWWPEEMGAAEMSPCSPPDVWSGDACGILVTAYSYMASSLVSPPDV